MRSIACLVLLAAVGCGGGGGDGSTSPTSATPPVTTPPVTTPPTTTPPTTSNATEVTVGNNSFSPADISVAVGATVTWTWNTCSDDPYGYGPSCVAHSVTFDNAGPASSTQAQGSYQRTFTAAGTYTYHCAVHGTSMSGKVTVR